MWRQRGAGCRVEGALITQDMSVLLPILSLRVACVSPVSPVFRGRLSSTVVSTVQPWSLRWPRGLLSSCCRSFPWLLHTACHLGCCLHDFAWWQSGVCLAYTNWDDWNCIHLVFVLPMTFSDTLLHLDFLNFLSVKFIHGIFLNLLFPRPFTCHMPATHPDIYTSIPSLSSCALTYMSQAVG